MAVYCGKLFQCGEADECVFAAWLPGTHASQFENMALTLKTWVENLKTGAKLGFSRSWIYDVNSIEGLNRWKQ